MSHFPFRRHIYYVLISVLECISRASKPNMIYTYSSIRRKKHRRNRTFYSTHRKPYIRAKAKEVTEIRFSMYAQTGYCVCPGCKCTFEREYQSYCDRCGQKLAWNLFNQNKVTLIKHIPYTVKKKGEKIREEKDLEAIIL